MANTEMVILFIVVFWLGYGFCLFINRARYALMAEYIRQGEEALAHTAEKQMQLLQKWGLPGLDDDGKHN